MKLPVDFKEFIELVNSENVQYLVIGGWAVNRYAEPRFTGDIDFFFENSAETEAKLRRVCASVTNVNRNSRYDWTTKAGFWISSLFESSSYLDFATFSSRYLT